MENLKENKMKKKSFKTQLPYHSTIPCNHKLITRLNYMLYNEIRIPKKHEDYLDL